MTAVKSYPPRCDFVLPAASWALRERENISLVWQMSSIAAPGPRCCRRSALRLTRSRASPTIPATSRRRRRQVACTGGDHEIRVFPRGEEETGDVACGLRRAPGRPDPGRHGRAEKVLTPRRGPLARDARDQQEFRRSPGP